MSGSRPAWRPPSDGTWPYSLCVQCLYPTQTREQLKTQEQCPACGSRMKTLNPKEYVEVKVQFPRLRNLLRYAKENARTQELKAPAVCKGAVDTVTAIGWRMAEQWRLRPNRPYRVNWGELELLGFWACQALMAPTTWTKEKLQGEVKRVADVINEIEAENPELRALSGVTLLLRDQLSKFFEEGPGRTNEGETVKPMTQEDIEQFPKLDLGLGPSVPQSMIRHVPDAVAIARKRQAKVLGLDGRRVDEDKLPEGLCEHAMDPQFCPRCEASVPGRHPIDAVIPPQPAQLRSNVVPVAVFNQAGRVPLEPGQWIKHPEVGTVLCCPLCATTMALTPDHLVLADGMVEPGIECDGPEGQSCSFRSKILLDGWKKTEEETHEG